MKKRTLIYIGIILVMAIFLVIPFARAIFKNSGRTSGTLATALWDVSLNQTGLSNNVSLVSGSGTQTYTLRVRNDSEVSATYAIEIGNIPEGVKIKLDTNQNYEIPVNNKITFSNAGTLLYSPQGSENTHTLTFTTETGTLPVSNRVLTVKVIIQQVI